LADASATKAASVESVDRIVLHVNSVKLFHQGDAWQ
jgi:hypothetical protein